MWFCGIDCAENPLVQSTEEKQMLRVCADDGNCQGLLDLDDGVKAYNSRQGRLPAWAARLQLTGYLDR